MIILELSQPELAMLITALGDARQKFTSDPETAKAPDAGSGTLKLYDALIEKLLDARGHSDPDPIS